MNNSTFFTCFRLGSDPEQLFSYSLMQEHLRKFGKIGLIFAANTLPIITAERGNTINLDEAANDMANKNVDAFDNLISEKSRDKHNKRLKGVVADMVRLEYI